MKISEKVVRRLWFGYLARHGFNSYMINYYGNHVLDDIFRNKENIPFKKRMWALKRGFCVDKINMYKLTEDNYKDYLSDYDYYRIFPLNNRYAMWINDKLTMKYTLYKYNEFLPDYYANVDIDGTYTYLMDYSEKNSKNIDGIIELLKKKGKLAVKKVAGAAGEGFYELSYYNNEFSVNKGPYSKEELKKFLQELRGYLFTEYIEQHEIYKKIWGKSIHTLRVQTVREKDRPIECLYSYIRWGSKNLMNCVGDVGPGVTAVVNKETGEIAKGFYQNENREWIDCKEHPDTGVDITGEVPHWEYILEKCMEMHEYMNELEYMGFDVIVTDNSFKICEINSHSGIRAVQYEYPLFIMVS